MSSTTRIKERSIDTRRPAAVLVISGTSSGVGKTTVTVGLMAAFAKRGYIVQPFKCGPDFLDGMHHEAAIRAGRYEFEIQQTRRTNSTSEQIAGEGQGEEKGELTDFHFFDTGSNSRLENPTAAVIAATATTTARSIPKQQLKQRRCVNLDGWMMGSTTAALASFTKHSEGADIAIIEGAMGLHDSRDGTTDEGSAAQIAKLLNAPVVLVIDGSMMARSVAAMALGYALFDPNVRLGAVVTNKVGGPVHVAWIAEAVEMEGNKRLKDVGTGEPVLFAGALPQDMSAAVPERHLGLKMPTEQEQVESNDRNGNDGLDLERFVRLAALVEDNLDLDALLRLGQKSDVNMHIPVQTALTIEQHPILRPEPSSTRCRIGIAEDEAFCFYYMDNLHLLKLAGAELVPFSPISSSHLPPALDGLYLGGGYPELHARKLEENKSLRDDIKSFCMAKGCVFAECGGLMYLSKVLLVAKDEAPRDMCGVLPITIRMTPHMKMYYSKIEFTSSNPVFPAGGKCRGQKFHFSEVMNGENANWDDNRKDEEMSKLGESPLLVTPQLPGALPEPAGYSWNNTFASYFHIHFASYDDSLTDEAEPSAPKTLAERFVENAISNSPHRKAFAVSFVSAATEIIFALEAQSTLAGVTSVCDFPPQAQYAPRRVVSRSPIDAASMTSEEVDAAMIKLRSLRLTEGKGPPGHWLIDTEALRNINPRVVFVQNTCDICDPSSDDVLHALECTGLDSAVTVPVAPTTLNGLFDSIEEIAAALDVQKCGAELTGSLRKRLERIDIEVATLTSPRPRVLSLEGLAPLCTGGNWLPDLKYAAGCVDALGDTGGCPARIIKWKEILDANPDILLISPCSASPARTLNEVHLLASSSEFWSLRCVQKGNVYIMDHGCFTRPGPRLVEGVEMMAALFRGVSAPSLSDYTKWKKEALKYQCCTADDSEDLSVSHCTTELAARFTPCFGGCTDDDSNLVHTSISEVSKNRLQLCNVTRCTIPNFQLPPDRSAHCFVKIKRRGCKKTSLLLIGGESRQAERLTDTWELHAPSNDWSAASELDDTHKSRPEIGTTATWEYLVCGKVAGEDVPTPRSNHASAACGEHIVIFGGWGVDNVTPLSNCELLHISSLCWTHCSTRGSSEPNPRGNPTLVFQRESNSVFLFGGWNGEHALNDVWCLDMNVWQWYNLTDKRDEEDIWPSPRTDHTAVLWETNQECDKMLVFGGNIEGFGPCSELWALDIPKRRHSNTITIEQGLHAPHWHQLKVSGPTPPARTSHSAAVVGKEDAPKMIIVGGTDSSRGVGRGSMLCDAWVLNVAGEKDAHPMWMKLDWSGNGLNRCRHSMAAVDSTRVVWWGGYDGEMTVNDYAGVWQGYLNLDSAVGSCTSEAANIASLEKEKENWLPVQERWEAEVPVREEDLPPETLAKAKRSRLPGALYKALHRHAVANNRDTYIDPASGYSVFGQLYLKRRPCCGNGCRHCPHGYINVPGKQKVCCDEEIDSNLEW